MKMYYLFEAKVLNVVDGDTIDVSVDLGFSVYSHQRLRLYGIDTEELTSTVAEERELAKKAKQRLIYLVLDKKIYIQTFKTDKYGRYLAKLYLNLDESVSVNDLLITENLAKPYFGGQR